MAESDPSLWLSRSWTTRPRRRGESADAYRFATPDEFEAEIDRRGFLEWAEFQGNRYGTPWPSAPQSYDVILEIDVQGAAQVHDTDPGALLVFLVPPSTDELQRRLEKRGDPPEKIAARMAIAEAERVEAAALGAIEIVNGDLGETVTAVRELIVAARSSSLPCAAHPTGPRQE